MNENDFQRLLILPVAGAVLIVWIASAIYSFLSGQYAPLTITTPVMLVLAGYVFGFRQVAKTLGVKNGGGKNGGTHH